MKKTHAMIAAFSALLAVAQFAAGAMINGDILVVDLGKTGQETTGNWNNVALAANAQFLDGQVLASDMVRYSDGAATGVSLAWDEVDGSSSFAGIGGATIASVGASASFTGIGTIPDNAQIDTSYFNGNSTLVLSGLDSSLTYNLEIMAKIDSGRDAQNITVNGTSISVDPDTAPYITTFTGISADVNDEIVISFFSTGGGSALQHVNALAVTAIPEPATLGLVAAFGGAVLFIRRRLML